MSLVQHVSSMDGADREPEHDGDVLNQTDLSSREHVVPIQYEISYNVLDRQDQTRVKAADSAYRVSVTKRVAQVILALLSCWTAAGVVFGFAALKPVMVNEKVYHNLCTKQELQDHVDLCKEQDLRLNFFYTMGTITANIAALPVGTILDWHGSRLCYVMGCTVLAAGCLLMAASFSRPNFDGYIPGNALLALGGTFIFVPSFRIAHAFPKYAGTIVALVTGAFDASAAVYLFYHLAYEQNPRIFNPRRFFLAYLAVPAFILVASLTVMPAHDYDTADQLQVKIQHEENETRDIHESDEEIEDDAELCRVRSERAEHRRDKLHMINTVFGDKGEQKRRQVWEQKCREKSGVWGVLHGLPAHKQVATPWFILILLMTALQMLRMNYFIATVRSQYRYMLRSEAQAEKINGLFDIALPIGGVLSTPFIGLLLDYVSVPATLTLIMLLTTTIGILNSVPNVWTGYLTVALFVLLRPYYYSAMSDYTTKVFGFRTFGRVYGCIICFSGLVNFAQYVLDYLTHIQFKCNPGPVNVFFAASSLLVGAPLVAFVYIAGKRLQEQEGAELESEWQRLIPGDEESPCTGLGWIML